MGVTLHWPRVWLASTLTLACLPGGDLWYRPVWLAWLGMLWIAAPRWIPNGDMVLRLPRWAHPRHWDHDRLAWTATLAAPALLCAIVQWGENFPFFGDHDYHLLRIRESAHFWLRCSVPAAFFFVGLAQASRRSLLSGVLVLGWFVLWRFLVERVPPFALRYPGLVYALEAPWAILVRLFTSDVHLEHAKLWTALVSAIGIWKIGAQRSHRWLWALFFWTPLVVYYQATNYLEPVMLLCAAMALQERTSAARSLAWLGLAALSKEQAFLLFPFVALSFVEPAPGLQGLWKRNRVLLFSTLFFATPFLLYLRERSGSFVTRGFTPLSWDALWISSAMRTWVAEFQFNYGVVGWAVIAASLTLSLLWAVRARFFTPLLFVFAGLCQWMFFWADELSRSWPGYGRFQVLGFLCLVSALVVGFRGTFRPHVRLPVRWLQGFATAFALLSIPALSFLKEKSRLTTERAFIEYDNAPLYLPVQEVFAQAPTAESRVVRLISAVADVVPGGTLSGGYQAQPFSFAYPEIARGRVLREVSTLKDPAACRCSKGEWTVMFTMPIRNRLAVSPLVPEIRGQEGRCVASLRAHCSSVRAAHVSEQGEVQAWAAAAP